MLAESRRRDQRSERTFVSRVALGEGNRCTVRDRCSTRDTLPGQNLARSSSIAPTLARQRFTQFLAEPASAAFSAPEATLLLDFLQVTCGFTEARRILAELHRRQESVLATLLEVLERGHRRFSFTRYHHSPSGSPHEGWPSKSRRLGKHPYLTEPQPSHTSRVLMRSSFSSRCTSMKKCLQPVVTFARLACRRCSFASSRN